MRRMFVFVAVVLVAGCSSLFGIDEGTHESLDAEIMPTRAEIEALIADADVLGEAVFIAQYDPLDRSKPA